jgi:hypothetical protein
MAKAEAQLPTRIDIGVYLAKHQVMGIDLWYQMTSRRRTGKLVATRRRRLVSEHLELEQILRPYFGRRHAHSNGKSRELRETSSHEEMRTPRHY